MTQQKIYSWKCGRFYVPIDEDIGDVFESHTNISLDIGKLREEFPVVRNRVGAGYITRGYAGYDGYNQESVFEDLFNTTDTSVTVDKEIDWEKQFALLPFEESQIKLRRAEPEKIKRVEEIVLEQSLQQGFSLEIVPFFWTSDFHSRIYPGGEVHIGVGRSYAQGYETERVCEGSFVRYGGWKQAWGYNCDESEDKRYPLALIISNNSENLDVLERRVGLVEATLNKSQN